MKYHKVTSDDLLDDPCIEVSLHATVEGKIWSGQRARLDIDRPLHRDKPLAWELAQILRDCGDFAGGAKAYTGDSFIKISRASKTKRGMLYVQRLRLIDFPSVAHLVR
jgi:hypothetical protein